MYTVIRTKRVPDSFEPTKESHKKKPIGAFKIGWEAKHSHIGAIKNVENMNTAKNKC